MRIQRSREGRKLRSGRHQRALVREFEERERREDDLEELLAAEWRLAQRFKRSYDAAA